MDIRIVRRAFLKYAVSAAAFAAGATVSFRKRIDAGVRGLGVPEAHAAGNPHYAMGNYDRKLRIEYCGMSCFLITASDGTRIITDPFIADDQNVLYPELKKEPADVVTVSCGHYSHCYVYAVGGTPYIFKRTQPATLKGATFRGVATRHLAMEENKRIVPGDNVVICFEVDGIRICHLGALGHVLSDEQVKSIGAVDILMVPVGGASTLPVADAGKVCEQLKPRVILPMHYGGVRCTFDGWAGVDEFLEGKKNVLKFATNVGASEVAFSRDTLPSETQIIVPRSVF